MAELIYTPGVNVLIDSVLKGIIDVSDDIESMSVNLVENGLHTVEITLANSMGKFDGILAPNDRISVRMKRLKWMQVFTGYLTEVPYFSAFQGSISVRANCTLKALKFFPWDARSVTALELFNNRKKDENSQDGGIGNYVYDLLTKVAKWPEDRVHIGGIPSNWTKKFQAIYEAVNMNAEEAEASLGINPIVAGTFGGYNASTPNGSKILNGLSDYVTFDDNEIDVILATIRQVESGNNYRAVNNGDGKGDIASGAYQFITSSWNNYGGYKDAYLAPPSVQDAKATELVRHIKSNYGNYVIYIPIHWYLPATFSDPSWLDKVPFAGEGNNKTVRQYADYWMTKWRQKWKQMMGTEAPSGVSDSGAAAVTPTSGQARYPIPQGTRSLASTSCVWGGYENGKIPHSAMKWIDHAGLGHPVAVQAFREMYDAAVLAGFDLSANCYRSYEQQAANADNPAFVSVPGTSIHGWGLAFDISNLVPNPKISKKYPNYTNDQMYETPEYKWLEANAWIYGFGTPTGKNANHEEAWHWEFFAFQNFKNGGVPGSGGTGYNPFTDASTAISGPTSDQLFSAINFWTLDLSRSDSESIVLTGIRSLMNDVPIITMISEMISSTMRSYCAAPNGDFIAWFPDYWGEYNISGKIDLELIELKKLEVTWSDEHMITHQFVEGSTLPASVGMAPEGIVSSLENYLTRGIVTVDLPNLLSIITNMEKSPYPWLTQPELLLNRFGARVARDRAPSLITGQHEFWFAVNQFTAAWAAQFSCSIPTTFLPEAFPGMILRIPAYGIQFYIRSVSHSINLADGGFETNISVVAPSATDGSGFFLFPTAGDYSTTPGGPPPGVHYK